LQFDDGADEQFGEQQSGGSQGHIRSRFMAAGLAQRFEDAREETAEVLAKGVEIAADGIGP
jgi:hypothetical protein